VAYLTVLYIGHKDMYVKCQVYMYTSENCQV